MMAMGDSPGYGDPMDMEGMDGMDMDGMDPYGPEGMDPYGEEDMGDGYGEEGMVRFNSTNSNYERDRERYLCFVLFSLKEMNL